MRRVLLAIAVVLVQVNAGPAQSSGDECSSTAIADDNEPRLLMQAIQNTALGRTLQENGIQVSGWTEMSFTASSSRFDQLPMGFNYRANDFLLQNHWLRLDKQADSASAEASFGFRIDTILPGSDYRFTIARGLLDGQLTDNNGEPATYGIDPVQFYVEANLPHIGNGLAVRVGRFFALYGIESIDPTLNALASRSYSFIYNPFTHTGIVATYKFNNGWSMQHGLVAGSDVFVDRAASPTYVGNIKWASENGPDSLQFSVILGSGEFDQTESHNNPQLFDLVYTRKIGDKLNYSMEALYAFQCNVPGIGDTSWFGVANYWTYAFTSETSGTSRIEFFDDSDGQRTGAEGLYAAVALGVSLKPTDALLLRPEIRFDHNNDSRPFEGEHSLLTAALDVLFRW